MKVYLTKYAVTTGEIHLIEVEPGHDPQHVFHREGHWSSYKIGRDVFHTEAEARGAVAAQINKRIASLQKQIDKLNKIEITVKA